MKQPRNIYGQPITRSGAVDQRYGTRDTPKAELIVEVVERPNDNRPWHVNAHNALTGEHKRVSRHKTEGQARRAAERLRMKQPDRGASLKLSYAMRPYVRR